MDRTKAHDARRPFAVCPYLLNSILEPIVHPVAFPAKPGLTT
ncbi:hypothetical protein [Pseudomonas palleroniana]|nr:hypothetical protein [Pseudomonas palleroniana]